MTPEERISKLNQVTLADINRVAQEVFTLENLNCALIADQGSEAEYKKLLTW